MALADRQRLSPATFRLPVDKIRDGYYSDAYFNHTKALLEADDHHPHVVMQVFQRKESILGGIDEAIAVLKQCTGRRGARRPVGERLQGRSRCARSTRATTIAPWETVMTIEGDYALFAHLETVYLGCLARRTLIMRNVHEVVEAANGKPILYFPARHDHWLVQTGDGWAAHVAGRDRRLDRRAGLVVGRPRGRHRPARADRGLRRRHRGGGRQVRRALRRTR